MKVRVSRYIVYVTMDDHFAAGTRPDDGRTEVNIIINIKLFSLN